MSASFSDPSELLGSASQFVPYGGSRKLRARYSCSSNSNAGFAELSPQYVMTGEQLYSALEKVSHVQRVAWKTSDAGPCYGNHYQDRAIRVYTSMNPYARPIEFKCTRNQHMLRDKDGNPFPFTVSVTFKDPPQELIPDAWRILDEVVRDKTVASQYFRAYMTESLNRHFGYKPA